MATDTIHLDRKTPMKANEEPHVAGVYHVRPDKTTSVVGVVGLAAFAWFANQWAAGVSTDSTEALRQAREAQQQQERQAVEIRRLADDTNRTVTTAIAPLQQRLDDMRSAASSAYGRQEAERDKALLSQELAHLRAATTDNQNTLQRLVGRLEVTERENAEIARRLELVYQALIEKPPAGAPTPSVIPRPTVSRGHQEG